MESETEPAEEADAVDDPLVEKEDDGFGGMKWECLAVTFDEVNAFVSSIEKSRDPNEKVLRKRIVDDLLPLLEKQEESRKRKAAQKERELLNLEKLATAKRSSRIAGKIELQRHEDEAREAERKKQQDLANARKEQEKWTKLEKERESRMMTREQRLKEREARRILHEEELANLSEDNKKLEAGAAAGRLSERHLKLEIERKKQALEELAEEEDWIFDCICGAYGQIDDGTHSIACDKCNIWQHSKCVGVSQAEADREDFHFICTTCQRRAKDAERAKTQPPIKIRLNRPGSSSSPVPPKQNGALGASTQSITSERPPQNSYHQSPYSQSPYSQSPYGNAPQVTAQTSQINGHPTSQWQKPYVPQQSAMAGPPNPQGAQRQQDQVSNAYPTNPVPAPTRYSPPHSGTSQTNGPQSNSRPSSSHAFSSPHAGSPTNLPPPLQPQSYSFVNGNAGYQSSNAPRIHSTPGQHANPGHPPAKSSPSPSRPGYGIPPSTTTLNGQQQIPISESNRRNSVALSSPLSGTPVLTPRVAGNQAISYPVPSSSPLNNNSQPLKLSPKVAATPQSQIAASQETQDTGHASILPPAMTGYSPTKHSPPRPMSANGNLIAATPSAIPPVASLSPSPQSHNLTPPVKASEPERQREYGQIAGS